MRPILIAITILTMLAQPVWAYSKEDCSSLETMSHNNYEASNSIFNAWNSLFAGRRYSELDVSEKALFDQHEERYAQFLLKASQLASIYAAFCKE